MVSVHHEFHDVTSPFQEPHRKDRPERVRRLRVRQPATHVRRGRRVGSGRPGRRRRYCTYASIFIVIFRHIIISSTPAYRTNGDERDDGGILIEDNCDSSLLQKIQYDIPMWERI